MSEPSLKKQTIKGIGWSAVERFSLQIIQFVIQIVMARKLLPSDYGIIGMLTIFLQLAQVFIDSGFANALVQKQNSNERDYSTVFFYNLAVSILFYICCFASAPSVARFYDIPLIVQVMRVQTITFLINAWAIIPKTILIKSVDFKTQSKVSLSSAVISGSVGIYLAYTGAGVWALCFQALMNSLLQAVLLYLYTKWRPILVFDMDSFRQLFKFGSKILAASIITVIYNNLYSIVIGKRYNSNELGLYSRADHFAMFPSNNIGTVISRVAFPVLSKVQDDDSKLLSIYSNLIRFSSFLIFPLMTGLIALSEPVTLALLGDNWSALIPILKIVSVGWMFDHLSLLNLNLLYVKGRSDLVLKLEVIKKTIAVCILFATLRYGLMVICWGKVIYTFIAVSLNTYYTKQLLDYGLLKQLKDYLSYLLASIFMAVAVHYLIGFLDTELMKLIIGLAAGAAIYIIITLLFFKDIYKEAMKLIGK